MAAPTLTPKLKLTTDPDGEGLVDNNYANWDKVDLAAGIQYVNSGQTAPLPYEGALVAERDTGIAYTLTSDGSGGWTKRYIIYPYQYVAYTPASGLPTTLEYAQWGWNTDTVGPQFYVNSGPQDRGPAAGWKAPIKGIYQVTVMQRWEGNANNYLLCGSLMLSGNQYYHMEQRAQSTAGLATCFNIQYERLFNAGDWVVGTYQTHAPSGTLNLYTSIWVTMIKPVA